jgi:hypothetical protein
MANESTLVKMLWIARALLVVQLTVEEEVRGGRVQNRFASNMRQRVKFRDSPLAPRRASNTRHHSRSHVGTLATSSMQPAPNEAVW